LAGAISRYGKGGNIGLGQQAQATAKIVKYIQEREWGLLVMDEVQVAPANTFRQIMSKAKVHCKLGLTATLVREDGKIQHLTWLIGPKLYEANWMDLQAEGHIAKVECNEVRVKMQPTFFKWYLDDHAGQGMTKAQVHHLKNRLFVMNPLKFQAMEYLIREHEARGDKIIVFSDDTFALKMFADKLYPNDTTDSSKQCYIRGDTATIDREKILRRFKTDPKFQTIFVSKIADNSLDLPDLSVLIQISSHGAGRRQEAQRLGRILRRKPGTVIGEVNAYFYSIVSVDTKDLAYNKGRQRYCARFWITNLCSRMAFDLMNYSKSAHFCNMITLGCPFL
jgi:DNA excision repair protein ERCC-3